MPTETALLDRPDATSALRTHRLIDPLAVVPIARLPRVGHPHAPGLEIAGAGATVPLTGGGRIEYANLDHGASAPALREVSDTVERLLQTYASVHRGAGWHSQISTSLYEGARGPIRSFVGGRADDAVVFTQHTTDAFGLLAHCLPARTTVVVFETEHHAALLPWERSAARVLRLPAPASPAAAIAAADEALRTRPAGPALLVVTGASNVTGELWPVARLAAVARARGARIALDAAQLAPHRAFSIDELGVDYVAISGHKLYAPFGAGALIGRTDWLQAAPPYRLGGGATATVTDDEVTFKPVPERHEAGSPNVPGAVALATACHLIAGADRDRLACLEAGLTEALQQGLADIPGVTVHRLFAAADAQTIGVVTFTIAGQSSAEVAAALSAEHGIGVRDGAFCAQPLVRRLLGAAGCSSPDGSGHALRASIGLGTTTEHVNRLVAAVSDIASRGPRLRYTTASGRPAPVADDRELPRIAAWQS
ncbi:aminotransferase class V-fold PLP-dependent enzyme [Nakamurella sp. YIM 132087]|uniref:Aminotransferase class V-fold PLP-dependent enzyme n=1 Tax=Nakamurella alba TaxID=2665158 RepID=A0A7K1FKA9_9ACTN|nr:aminotransferase class V-fold PLP-dependent enzyme [Nakamurella alba]MTD14575.1 aminotransferase class V-fold PLP-dependent enzyme [Nakamurella alba]